MNKTNISECEIIELPVISSNRKGSLTPIYNDSIPFQIQRVYYLYDVPFGSKRGGHAHKKLEQIIIAPSGSFNVELDDGSKKKVFNLNRPSVGLYVPRMLWRELTDFSGGGICVVLASLLYDEKDYIRDYDNFIKYKNKI